MDLIIELARVIGLDPKWAASTAGGEYKSACPACGGDDRFYIQPYKQQKNCVGYYCCRVCKKSGDAIQFCIDFFGDSVQSACDRLGVTLQEKPRYSTQVLPLLKALKKQAVHKPFEVIAPSTEWIKKAGAFVNWSHDQLLHNPGAIKYLTQRGIPLEAIKLYKIGLCPRTLHRQRTGWGLQDQGDSKYIWLPEGIVIPVINPNGDVIRLKIRRKDYRDGDEFPKYVAVSGSANGLNIIGDKSCDTAIVVESELDAYALHYAVGDFAIIIAVGSNIKNPDNMTDYLAKQKSKLLICYDNDDAGRKMLDKWAGLYSHARGYPTPVGKDIGEAIQGNVNIREWLLNACTCW